MAIEPCRCCSRQDMTNAFRTEKVLSAGASSVSKKSQHEANTMSPRTITLIILVAGLSFGSARAAQGDVEPAAVASASPRAFAIVVGNNAGGAGQHDLRFAERDAERLRDVLVELAGYELQEPMLLQSPSPTELWNAFERVQVQVEEEARAGRETVLFFYYSGHARSSALDFGDQRVELIDLRRRILAMPASLRVVVLDACQSGAFSRIKGAAPASDFSVSSVASLTATGVAVMASSSATELSQESDDLQGSYFTHHLLAGLRGAADQNADGAVSLAEAYQYAYHNTLSATAVSAVGKQHVTLETDLRGKGEVALTRPARADASLRVPKALAGALTVLSRPGNAVVAELNKASGKVLSIALPAGDYRVIVRSGPSARQCEVALRKGRSAWLANAQCQKVSISMAADKGAGAEVAADAIIAPESSRPRWEIELAGGVRGFSGDSFTTTLEDFGYNRKSGLFDISGQYRLSVLARVHEHLLVGLETGSVESEHYYRETDGASSYDFLWSTKVLSALVRARYSPTPRDFHFYIQGDLGLTRTATELRQGDVMTTRETYYGPSLQVGAGAVVMALEGLGLVFDVRYLYAPTVDNELGQTRASGGWLTSLGLRAAF